MAKFLDNYECDVCGGTTYIVEGSTNIAMDQGKKCKCGGTYRRIPEK